MRSRASIFFTVVLAATLLDGIAPVLAASHDTPVASAPGDPWERQNRRDYAIEGALDRHVIGPAARFYHKVTPGPIGRGIHNVLVNLSEPVVIINDLLQLRFRRAGMSTARLATNSTLGLLGLFDMAGRAGLPYHGNEFGVTLGRYGVPSGPYMYVPLVGPSTVRDFLGAGVDLLMNPLHWLAYPDRTDVGVSQATVSGLDTRVMTEDQLNTLLSGAVDPYATLRSVYLQNKKGEVEDEGVPQELPSFDETPVGIGAPPAPHPEK
ncbi:MAG TPA: VacJ family lipoprotein [Steroidobacteraceae bacterium]|jgi:phospholipid-binding lipoprotein MlaA|nr:VacJ family lipoprotein [Steroidobacteraceae bacterium]